MYLKNEKDEWQYFENASVNDFNIRNIKIDLS